MSEHQKQTAFFKAMVREAATPEHRQLRDRILKAEEDERCCRRAMLKVLALIALSLIGGLYTAVVMPEVVLQQSHVLKKLFEVVALGSVLSLTVFGGCWLYYRAVLFQVHSECRRFLMSTMSRKHSRPESTPNPSFGEFAGAH